MTAVEICTQRAIAGELIGDPCPNCGHTNLAHGGGHNPAVDACVICELQAMTVKPAPIKMSGPEVRIHVVDDIEPKRADRDDDASYRWEHVALTLGGYVRTPIHVFGAGKFTVAGARKLAAELLSAAKRVEEEDR